MSRAVLFKYSSNLYLCMDYLLIYIKHQSEIECSWSISWHLICLNFIDWGKIKTYTTDKCIWEITQCEQSETECQVGCNLPSPSLLESYFPPYSYFCLIINLAKNSKPKLFPFIFWRQISFVFKFLGSLTLISEIQISRSVLLKWLFKYRCINSCSTNSVPFYNGKMSTIFFLLHCLTLHA